MNPNERLSAAGNDLVRSMNALRLELPTAVWDDHADKVNAYLQAVAAKFAPGDKSITDPAHSLLVARATK